jgi:acetate kinase
VTGLILTLNAGSSSLKFGLFQVAEGQPALLCGHIELGLEAEAEAEAEALGMALDALNVDLAERCAGMPLQAVGHRVVHGGADHIAPEVVTPAVLAALLALTPLDPLHMPRDLAPIDAITTAHPDLLQVACFDTAFHHTMPAAAQRFGLPRAMTASGLRHYGFQGLSCEYIAGPLATTVPMLRRVVVAHVGAGASLCALRDARSIATTTGFSTLDGLLMATRCGSLDPGVILHLGRQGMSFEAIEDMLYRQSGVLGVSGISDDTRVLPASDAPGAREAIELFTCRVALEVGAMATALGGLDGLVFSAGIGDHAAPIRAAICARLAWMGLELDEAANAAGAACISRLGSPVAIRIIPTDEEAMVGRHTRAIMAGEAPA